MKTQRKNKTGKNNRDEEPAGLHWPGAGDRMSGCGWEHPGLLVCLHQHQPAEHHQLLCGVTGGC